MSNDRKAYSPFPTPIGKSELSLLATEPYTQVVKYYDKLMIDTEAKGRVAEIGGTSFIYFIRYFDKGKRKWKLYPLYNGDTIGVRIFGETEYQNRIIDF